MKENPQKVEITDLPPKEIWDTILRVSDFLGSEEVKTLRVLLYIGLLARDGDTLRVRLGHWRGLSRWLFHPVGRQFPNAPKGCPLFAFLFPTASNMSNLLPVLRAARRRGWHPSILTGQGVALSPEDLEGTAASVRPLQLIAATTIDERLAALAGAWRHYRELLGGFERVAPQWAGTVRSYRSWILTALAFSMAVRHGLRRLYAAWEPSSVVSTSDLWPFDHTMFAEAGRAGLPTFVIQHGVPSHFWWPSVAGKLLLWGEAFCNEFEAMGTPADRFSVCGAPASDHLFRRYAGNTGSDFTKPLSSFVILSATQAESLYADLYAKYREMLGAVLAATPSIQWSVKLHPQEDGSFYREMEKTHHRRLRILPKTTSLEEAVRAADVACTLFSTAGLEAMVMRRPLVVFDLGPIIHDYAWWPKCGGGTYIHSVEDMLGFIERASADSQFVAELVTRQDDFLVRTFANPGQASEAVLDTIEKARFAEGSAKAVQCQAAE